MKLFIIAMIGLLALGQLFAETTPVEFGTKVGFNLAQHYGTKVDETEFQVKAKLRPGIVAGVYMNYRLLDNLRLGYELLYSMKGSREQITAYMLEGETLARPAIMNVRYDLDYLEIPVALRIRTISTPRLSLEAITGTAMSLKIHGHHELDGTVYLPDGDGFDEIPIVEESDLASVNMFDYSFIYGAALQYHGKLDISTEFRFTLGWDYLQLPTFSLGEPVELRNQTYSLSVGIQF